MTPADAAAGGGRLGPPATVTRLVPPREDAAPLAEETMQGTLALDLRSGPPLLPVPDEYDAQVRSRLPGPAEAEVRSWAARLAQAAVEVVGGRRPAGQLARWATTDVLRDLEKRSRLVRRSVDPGHRALHPQVRSVHVSCPSPCVAEVSVHLRHAARSRALALRLERRGGRWICTALAIG